MNTADTDGVWMTKVELARVRGIDVASAYRLIRRQGWRRQPGNDGAIRVLVPTDWAKPRKADPTDIPTDENAEVPTDNEALPSFAEIVLQELRAQFERERARADRAEAQAVEANKRADVAVMLADRTIVQLAETSTVIEALRGDLRDKDDELAELRAAADVASIRVREAQEAAEALRRDLEAAQADRTAAVAIADEAVRAAEELRAAEVARAGQGRWARLMTAWRGER